MSEYLPSFIVEPVNGFRRRFSARLPDGQNDHLLNRDESESRLSSVAISPGYLPSLPDLQRFYPSRYWNTATPPLPVVDRDETTEGSTWQSLARNIVEWANQINNLDIDVVPATPLDQMTDNAIVEDGNVEFPPLEHTETISRPGGLDHRTISETSLNPAEELPYRSRALEINRSHAVSDPMNHPGSEQPMSRSQAAPVMNEYRRRDGSGQLPEDDGMGALRQRINAIMLGPGTSSEKSKLVHILMTESYNRSQAHIVKRGRARVPGGEPSISSLSVGSTQVAQPMFDLSKEDLEPSYAPPNIGEGGVLQAKRDLGCQHYKADVKMQCVTCSKFYTCRFCHDEAEDHAFPRRETRFMLCMLCQTPQSVGDTCKNCYQTAAYYCGICKLFNSDPEKSIYHCDDCGICRLGQGLGKDFFHCKTCVACMSISAEKTHKCVQGSTQSDCPVCKVFLFTSVMPVAFMKCGHAIHSSCFQIYATNSYKCPICSKSIANMESQFRRLDRYIEEQPMPEEYRDNRAYVFCNDCNSRNITKYHWLGLKCSVCESYNTTQLELLGPEQTPQQFREQAERAQDVGEAGLTASQGHSELTSPIQEGIPIPGRQDPNGSISDIARSPTSPHLLPHSPTRSARSVTPVIGSYFGTGEEAREPRRRESYFSMFSTGQPATPQSVRTPLENVDQDSHMNFWGRQSPRMNDVVMETIENEAEEFSSSSDEVMSEEEDDDDDGGDDPEDVLDLPGHR